MMIGPESTQARPKRRRRTRAKSRQALVESTLRAMAKGAPLTSGAIAQGAGLAQPTFYAYFKNVDEAMLAAAQSAAEQLTAISDARRARLAENPDDVAAVARWLEEWLEATEATGPLHDALAPHARDRSPLGGLIRAVAQHSLTRLADDLFVQAQRFGVGPERYPVFVQLAATMNASTAATGRLLAAGQLTDRRGAAWVLARSLLSSMRANILACGGTEPPWDLAAADEDSQA